MQIISCYERFYVFFFLRRRAARRNLNRSKLWHVLSTSKRREKFLNSEFKKCSKIFQQEILKKLKERQIKWLKILKPKSFFQCSSRILLYFNILSPDRLQPRLIPLVWLPFPTNFVQWKNPNFCRDKKQHFNNFGGGFSEISKVSGLVVLTLSSWLLDEFRNFMQIHPVNWTQKSEKNIFDSPTNQPPWKIHFQLFETVEIPEGLGNRKKSLGPLSTVDWWDVIGGTHVISLRCI